MYHLFLDNGQHNFNNATLTTKMTLDYLQYMTQTTGVLVNLKSNVDLMKRPLQRTLFQVGQLDTYRFHPNDINLLQTDSGEINWESDKLEPFHLECDLRVIVEYPNADNIKVTGESLIGKIPLTGYGLSICRTNYFKPNRL